MISLAVVSLVKLYLIKVLYLRMFLRGYRILIFTLSLQERCSLRLLHLKDIASPVIRQLRV